MISRDQMVGPWQVPVGDVAVTVSDYFATSRRGDGDGRAHAGGAARRRRRRGAWRWPRRITNIAAADIRALDDVRLSANWMAACGEPGEDAALYDTVRAVGEELCPALGIAIPVGKDSLSMQTAWRDGDGERKVVVAPVSLIVSAFAPVDDVRRTLTPQLRIDARRHAPAAGRSRRGPQPPRRLVPRAGLRPLGRRGAGSATTPRALRAFFDGDQRACVAQGLLLAYHDRSDGGLFVDAVRDGVRRATAALDVDLVGPTADAAARVLFAEELGAVLQVTSRRRARRC